MAHVIFMPKLSSTMEAGTILQWFKEEGETVEMGEPIFEIMTDKINIEVEAYDDGILLKRYFYEDDAVPVNQVIGYIGEHGEVVPDQSPGIHEENQPTSIEASTKEEESTDKVNISVMAEGSVIHSNEKVRATPAAKRVAKENNITLAVIAGTGPNGRIQEKDVLAHVKNETTKKATPLAKKMAVAEQVELTTVNGTGVHSKIRKQDIATLLNSCSENISSTSKKLSGMRRVIAEKMQQSVNTAPHVTLTTEIDMSKVKDIRSQLLATIEKQTGYRLSFTEIIMKATAICLSYHPSVNASLIGDEIYYNDQVNIGLAVAVEDGLMVPVLRDVNKKGLSALTTEAKEIGKNAREMKIKPDQMKGSTFTISNLGMYAIDAFTPIINLPETAILGIGRIQDKPVVIDRSIEIRPMMVASLSFDHRVIDGAPAAAFLTELKRILENPYELLV